ncbi:MAG: hypothetical protein ACD_73C00007G0003 [uncultured bacterium]|nr:MAG: hypothetical protein ACD_73C00007G0003 [uncultured bacterium]
MSEKNYTTQESVNYWKKILQADMPADWAQEIDQFETDIHLKKQGKVEDRVFAETRLRRGAYGQRYDNGKRHDGKENRPISYEHDWMKGPGTYFDAPGMLRIKIPYGGMNSEQMEVLASLAEEYSDSILHVTTRQDFQLHYINIEDTPTVFRRLAAVGITTKEACGNAVRNITGCPVAGVCSTEAFDTTGYSDALFRFLLGHPDAQDFGRKFKVAFSGCAGKACAMVRMHDLGFVAKNMVVDGEPKRGFEMYVGGGLGAVPQQAKLLSDSVSEEEMMPLTQAICRIFARFGEKKNRNRARIKFLVSDWGIEKFRDAVFEERNKLSPDPRWIDYIPKARGYHEEPLKELTGTIAQISDPQYQTWLQNNVEPQKQAGYSIVTIALPLGDISSNQMRDLVDICHQYLKETIRTTVEQNIVLRWIPNEDLASLYQDLKKANLAECFAGTLVDITSCPGTDTCKLGVSASRGLAGELRERLLSKAFEMDESIRNLKIKVSGCFNSCSQHHVADIGFYGISRKVGGYLVPHFQLILGGQMHENGSSYGLAIGGLPSKSIPAAVERLTDIYLKNKNAGEPFQDFIKRRGKVTLKKDIEDLTVVPTHAQDASYYVDWGDVREFTTNDIGMGECAGEVVSLTEFGLAAADREVFESQVALEAGQFQKALEVSFKAMLLAAQGLIKGQNPDVSDKPDAIVKEFKTRFYDTEIFFDPFMKGTFADHLFKACDKGITYKTEEEVRQRVEEAMLFIDAAHACDLRMSMVSA